MTHLFKDARPWAEVHLEMPSIAIFTPTRSSIILLSRVYRELIESTDISILHYDVVEEHGWFEKGLQYISLEYDKPRRVIRYRDTEALINEVREVVERDEPDLAVLAGYSPATKTILDTLSSLDVRTIHLESGLRTYIESEEEYLRQYIDWHSTVNLTPGRQYYENLVREGFPREQLYNVGSPIVDAVLTNISRAERLSSILDEIGLERRRYILAYTGSRDPSRFLEAVGEASLKWDIDVVIPLAKWQKKRLIDMGLYYESMTKYLVIPIEIQDYLDHLSLINNSRHVVTDSPELALESSVLRRGVTLITGSPDLYNLVDRGVATTASIDELSSIPVERLGRRRGLDVSKVFGGGESHLRIVDAVKGFVDARLTKPIWRGPRYSHGGGEGVELGV